MKTISMILVSFALASCLPDSKPEFLTPTGKRVYSLTCETLADCAKEARKLCPDQYHIVTVASGADDTSAKGGIGDTPVQRQSIECE